MAQITTVIPCYNQGEYIEEAINSILNQTFKDIDIIVVNDGSTEKSTVDILNSLNSSRTRIIHTENKGPGAARNLGISQTNAEYILLLDADDYFLPTYLQKAVNIIEIKNNIGVVTCGVTFFGDNNQNYMPKGGDVKNFLVKNNSCGNSLFRRICWEQAAGFDESMIYGSVDWDFWIRITKLGWLVEVIPEYLFFYRQHGYSISTEREKRKPEIYRYIVNSHREVFEKYIDFVLYEKEKTIYSYKHENAALKNDLYSIYNNKAFKLSKIISALIRKLKKLKQHLSGLISHRKYSF